MSATRLLAAFLALLSGCAGDFVVYKVVKCDKQHQNGTNSSTSQPVGTQPDPTESTVEELVLEHLIP
jgi:hypothetical protein